MIGIPFISKIIVKLEQHNIIFRWKTGIKKALRTLFRPIIRGSRGPKNSKMVSKIPE